MNTSNERFFIDADNVDAMGFDWGRFTITCSPERNGAQGFSAGVVEMEPRQGHGRHNHPGAEEIIFVISGRGEQMVEDEKGNPIIQEVSAGCTIYVPADRFHYTINTSDEPMTVFVVYTPAGSERQLTKLPDFRKIPPKRAARS